VNLFDSSWPSLRAYLVGAYLFSVPAFAYSRIPALLLIPQALGALLMGYALLDILRDFKVKIPLELGLYGLMAVWAAATYALWAIPDSLSSVGLWTLLKVVAATFACAQLIKNENDLFTAIKIFAFSIVFVVYQNMAELRYLRIAGRYSEQDRFAGTLSNPNTAAMFALAVIWAAIVVMLHSRKGLVWKLPYLLPIGLSLVIIYYSGSKKGLVGLGLFVIFLARLLYIRQKPTFFRRTATILVSAALIVIAGYLIITSPFFFRIQESLYGVSESTGDRVILVKEALDVWLTNVKTFFIGVGYYNFRFYSTLQLYSHSTPLELLASTGLVGCSLFIAFLSLLILKFVRLYRATAEIEQKSVLFASLIFLSVYFFFMLTSVLHASRELLPILGCLAAFGRYQLERQKAADVPIFLDSQRPV